MFLCEEMSINRKVDRRFLATSCSFDSLPSILVGSKILSQYLCLNDLSALDIAVTNNKQREYLLECFSFCSLPGSIRIQSNDLTAWLKTRKVGLESIEISVDDNKSSCLDISYALVSIPGNFLHLQLEVKGLSSLLILIMNKKCTNLKYLDFYDIEQPLSSFINNILDCCHSKDLRGLKVNSSLSMDDEILTILEKYPKLCDLHLGAQKNDLTFCSKPYYLLNDSILQNNLSCLRTLYLCRSLITSYGLFKISKKCPLLKSLTLSECESLTNNAIEIISTGFPKLTSLSLFRQNITDSDILKIGQGCKYIERIGITSSTITDLAATYIASAWPKLHSLCVYSHGITSEFLLPISVSCINLRALFAAGCSFTDTSLMIIGQSFHQLIFLDLQYALNITDTGVYYMAKGCPVLTYLNLASCIELTDLSTKYLSQYCPKLEIISLRHCCQLTDLTLQHISYGCAAIHHLIIDSPLYTDRGIRHLIRRLRKLAYLKITLADKVSLSTLLSLIKVCPNIKIKCNLSFFHNMNLSNHILHQHFVAS